MDFSLKDFFKIQEKIERDREGEREKEKERSRSLIELIISKEAKRENQREEM